MTLPSPAVIRDRVEAGFRAWLNDMPSTAWIIFTGTVAGLATCVVYLAAMLAAIAPEPVTFGIWCGTVAGWIGFGVRQFAIKRRTHDEHGPQGQAARAARASGATPQPPEAQ